MTASATMQFSAMAAYFWDLTNDPEQQYQMHQQQLQPDLPAELLQQWPFTASCNQPQEEPQNEEQNGEEVPHNEDAVQIAEAVEIEEAVHIEEVHNEDQPMEPAAAGELPNILNWVNYWQQKKTGPFLTLFVCLHIFTE